MSRTWHVPHISPLDTQVPVLSLTDDCAACMAPPHRPGPVTFEISLPRLGQAATSIYTYFDPHIMGRECVRVCLPVRQGDWRVDWIYRQRFAVSCMTRVCSECTAAWSARKWMPLPSYMVVALITLPHSFSSLALKQICTQFNC